MVRNSNHFRLAEAGNTILILLLFLVLAASAVGVTLWYAADRARGKEDLPHVQLEEKLIVFAHQKTPEFYRRLVLLNDALLLLDRHLEHLESLRTRFPRQKSLVNPEIAHLTQVQKNLTAALGRVEAHIEAFYVADSVDPRGGIARQMNAAPDALKAVDNAYQVHGDTLRNLRAMEPKSLLAKLKERIF